MTNPTPLDRTAWMSGHFGLMTHWLFPGVMPETGGDAGASQPARSLDEAVDQFNVSRLLEDFDGQESAATGAEWFLLTD